MDSPRALRIQDVMVLTFLKQSLKLSNKARLFYLKSLFIVSKSVLATFVSSLSQSVHDDDVLREV